MRTTAVPTRRSPRGSTGVVLLVLLAFSLAFLPAGSHAASTSPVTGSFVGPTYLAEFGHATYDLNGSGGPAFAPNGTKVGNLSYYIYLAGANLTGVSIAPTTGLIVPGFPAQPILTVGGTPEEVTVLVELASTFGTANSSTNFTYTVAVVQPYVVTATLVATPSATVLSFNVTVELDGSPVGTVKVPSLTPGQRYNLSYDYATLGLAAGSHTFSISLATEHGLVTFAGGATEFSETVYVTGPAPNYTLWYVTGIVAFFGVLFIFATRVAARRRGALRR